LLLAGDDVAGRFSALFKFIHSRPLDGRGVLPWLLDLQPNGMAVAKAQEVGQARELVRAAVNLDRHPAERLCGAHDRGNYRGLAWHSFAISKAKPLKHRRHCSHTATIDADKLS
jgi:hypothetical protein